MPGGLNDDNGYLPFTAPMPLAAKRWDANIVAFSLLVLLLVAGTVTTVAAG